MPPTAVAPSSATPSHNKREKIVVFMRGIRKTEILCDNATLKTKACLSALSAAWRGSTINQDRRCSWKTSSRSEEHTSELQSQSKLVCRLLLEKIIIKMWVVSKHFLCLVQILVHVSAAGT